MLAYIHMNNTDSTSLLHHPRAYAVFLSLIPKVASKTPNYTFRELGQELLWTLSHMPLKEERDNE